MLSHLITKIPDAINQDITIHSKALLTLPNGDCLAPYTTVCRRWQAACEPFIYSNLIVYSDETQKDDQRGISLVHFQRLISGAGAIRRAWIQNLQYDILVPFELLDWTTRKRETDQYRIANPVREANNRAFQTAIINLFGILGQWDRNNRLSLDLGLRGRRVGENPAPEPNTSYFDIAGDYRHDFKTGRTDAVPPYRARFHNNYASVLAYASCVDKLSFTNRRIAFFNARGEHRHRYHQIWAGTVAQIVQHCPTVTELYLNLDEWVRPDHLEYIKAPCQWLALPTAEWQEEIDEIEDWEEEICDYESGCVDRSINDDEQFHRFFISLGYAARYMPRLRYIQFSLDHGPTTTFSFRRDLDPITAEWLSEADPEYRPDERVAKAWGFRLEDIEITGAWDMESVVRFAY
ncbi:hypothetical protein BDV37DRAFT_294665 [Aspergillus pseudonomiae]|uniref:F-box domain-containing protein n=1 Tax=Aspergillus pseudonomiae TaxID=1506151 RepID=A0A5N7DA24_9EURO|nr:uncharacterized protein BDV37DRAFT_294665 [Aspergillus pseudonomiae]KAE8403241.1 hypothetical protein BDV37DRAFT_294665 [Aspergillus pseudonomiae]